MIRLAARSCFLRAGQEIAVYDFNESDLALTNGSIVPNSLSLVRPGVYSFQLALDNFNQDAVLSIAQGLLTDDPRYAQPNEAAQVTIRKMHRAVTRAEDCLPGGLLIRILSILRPQRVRPRCRYCKPLQCGSLSLWAVWLWSQVRQRQNQRPHEAR